MGVCVTSRYAPSQSAVMKLSQFKDMHSLSQVMWFKLVVCGCACVIYRHSPSQSVVMYVSELKGEGLVA